MKFIEEYGPLAEFIYFLSGPLLLLGIVVAILQLYFFRKEAKSRFKRETIHLSLVQLEKRLKNISILQDELWEAELSNDYVEFKGSIKDLCRSAIECENSWLDWMESDGSIETRNTAGKLANEIEHLSNYIYSGITDEKLCFKLEGESIIGYVDNSKHYIAWFRETESAVTYSGVYRMYSDWNKRTTHRDLITQKKKIDGDLSKIKKINTVRIVGVTKV